MDPERGQEGAHEDAGGGQGAGEEGQVRSEQGESAEESGARADGASGQGVYGAGVADVPRQAPEPVADEGDAEQAEEEDERDGGADRARDPGAVESHGERRAHHADGERPGLPESELALGPVICWHGGSLAGGAAAYGPDADMKYPFQVGRQ
ncbi:hypothetical protein AB0L85_21310 [Streptomyces sp. NPDC052051]|uniref:hypothetical protein n=1 Tax=Streptomyces sp. NPDC052051 TaxID=3154649 RepID=UPI0034195FF9